MKYREINGKTFEGMIQNALSNLKIFEERINELNVFPVPDGDTGSNMRLTLENGVKNSFSNNHLGEYLNELANGMLVGARGNSGVILSQLFYGLADSLKNDSIVNSEEFKEAFINAYKEAYKAVNKPVEGTLLTVARQGIENIRSQINKSLPVENFFSYYLAEIRKVLSYTPELLPILKEAGVVDSGGFGYVIIIEGMFKFLDGEIINVDDNLISKLNPIEAINIDEIKDNKNLKYGFCNEFTIRLNKNRFDEEDFKNELSLLGNSIVCVHRNETLKVHIHTKMPAKVIEYVSKFGDILNFKLENMDDQHEEIVESNNKIEHKFLAKIAISNSELVSDLFKDLGCDIVIKSSKTMNVSAEEILGAINKLDFDNCIIFVNNKNNILTAEQAIRVSNKNNIKVIKSGDVLEGYYALANDMPDSENFEYRLNSIQEGLDAIKTIKIFKANRDAKIYNKKIDEGDYASLFEEKVLSTDSDIIDCVIDALKKVDDIKSKSNCIILKGKTFNDNLFNKLEDKILQKFDTIEVSFVDGGQPIYDLIIGLI